VKDVVWIAGILFLVFPGTIVWRLEGVRRLDLAARLAIAFACGLLITATLFYLYSLAHVPWTRMTIGVPLLVLGLIGVWGRASRAPGPARTPAPTLTAT
jgi:predicted membrane-bound mannosyltransferase